MKNGLITVIALCLILASAVMADPYLETLTKDQQVGPFTVKSLYDNSSGEAMGARFISNDYGFVLDVLRVQSVPQAFFWVKSAVDDDRGEPHACEHLLLGKGNRGRYVSTLEDMSLSTSTAYTSTLYTAYPFYTNAGVETFFELFEAKLDAMLNPDFSDEEIRREVCHIGVVENQETGELEVAEKGTVYSEMVSACEQYYYHLYPPLDTMLYGPGHPLGANAGGIPDVMRDMVPQHMWDFHEKSYRLGNMGAIFAIGDEIEIEDLLTRMDGIFNRVQPEKEPGTVGTIGAQDLPPVNPTASPGELRISTYPSENPEDAGYIVLGYPANLAYSNHEHFMLDLFLETFSSGPSSNLYDLFINSETRIIDLGGNNVWGGSDLNLGHPITFGVPNIRNQYVTEQMVDSVRGLIVDAIREVYNYADGSEELAKFNENARARLTQNAKQFDRYMNSPPGFGFRGGGGGGWYGNLKFLERDTTFRKSLVQKEYFDFAGTLLDTDRNFWKEYIDGWNLLSVTPFAVGCKPDAEMIATATTEKEARIAAYVEQFKEQYGSDDPQVAIAAYKAEFDARTAELEAAATDDDLPGFIDNPPMTLDDQLKYEEMTLDNGIPMVASTFDNMTTSTVGIALGLDVIPESLLVYVPFMSMGLDAIGVYKDGEVVDFEEMQNRIRMEILSLSVYPAFNKYTDRAEFVVKGAGSNLEELHQAIGWMEAILYSPYLSVDNLPRIRDLIDQGLVSLRNSMKGKEEYWVTNPSTGYRYQDDPLYLVANCFLTQTHAAQRMKWLFADAGTDAERQALTAFFAVLADEGKGKTREELTAFFDAVENGDKLAEMIAPEASDAAKEIAKDVVMGLKATMPEIPDADLEKDWGYLCTRIEADLMTSPEVPLAALNHMLDLVRKTDNARMFMISSTADREGSLAQINTFAGKLDASTPSVKQVYSNTMRIIDRARDRYPGQSGPLYAGLMHENTRNGVLIFVAKMTEPYDSREESILSCLASKLYSGGGPHGLFMKTWAAGLAYSNGYNFNSQTGFCSYYAERCPDVAETMRFVVNEMKGAEPEERLTEYAVALLFGSSRAASQYESRGEAMAANLADGITPERVAGYRQAVLDTRDREGLFQDLVTRMEDAYGKVLIGYGPSLAESDEGRFFVIGPEAQFASLETYIEANEAPQQIWRLYPRDYWLAAD